MLWKMDESIGKVVDALHKSGMLENTIIVFSADNGAPTKGLYPNWGSNYPLRGVCTIPFLILSSFRQGYEGFCVFQEYCLKTVCPRQFCRKIWDSCQVYKFINWENSKPWMLIVEINIQAKRFAFREYKSRSLYISS